MSYAVAAALQAAVFVHLEADTDLVALVGTAIFDAAPPGPLPGTYVLLGAEEATDRSDKTHAGAIHDFTIGIVTDVSGFNTVKTVAAVISDALVGADLSLARGRLVSLNFLRAKAERIASGTQRRVNLRFRALVEDS